MNSIEGIKPIDSKIIEQIFISLNEQRKVDLSLISKDRIFDNEYPPSKEWLKSKSNLLKAEILKYIQKAKQENRDLIFDEKEMILGFPAEFFSSFSYPEASSQIIDDFNGDYVNFRDSSWGNKERYEILKRIYPKNMYADWHKVADAIAINVLRKNAPGFDNFFAKNFSAVDGIESGVITFRNKTVLHLLRKDYPLSPNKLHPHTLCKKGSSSFFNQVPEGSWGKTTKTPKETSEFSYCYECSLVFSKRKDIVFI